MTTPNYEMVLSVKISVQSAMLVAGILKDDTRTKSLGEKIEEAYNKMINGKFIILCYWDDMVDTSFECSPDSYQNTVEHLIQLQENNKDPNISYQIVQKE